MKRFTKFKGYLREEETSKKHYEAALNISSKQCWLDTQAGTSRYMNVNVWMPKYNPTNEYRGNRPGLKLNLSIGVSNSLSLYMNHDEAIDDLIYVFAEVLEFLKEKQATMKRVHDEESRAYFDEILRKIEQEHKRQELYVSIKSMINKNKNK